MNEVICCLAQLSIMYYVYVNKQATVKLSGWHPQNFHCTSKQKRKLHVSLASYYVWIVNSMLSKRKNEIVKTNSYVVRLGACVVQSYLKAGETAALQSRDFMGTIGRVWIGFAASGYCVVLGRWPVGAEEFVNSIFGERWRFFSRCIFISPCPVNQKPQSAFMAQGPA